MVDVTIDRERALITARSILANVDILEGEGLDTAGQTTIIEVAERLVAGIDTVPGLEDHAAAGLAGQLRATLSTLRGRTAGTLVVWLDEVLDPDG
jgi:hypothetical protein